MYRRARTNFAFPCVILSLLFYLTVTGCKQEYPPFDEYQVVGFVGIDALQRGILFINGDRLFALYDTSDYTRWSILREYDLQSPTEPALLSAESMPVIPAQYVVTHQDSFVFFERLNYTYNILNLTTREFYSFNTGYSVHDFAQKDDFLFVSANDGLHVWDISNLPQYVEVFNDTALRSNAFLRLRDTILLDIYYAYDGYRMKIWNVTSPENPLITSVSELPDQIWGLRDVAITSRYFIWFETDQISRYRHVSYDSLVYEDAIYLDRYFYEKETSDSLICLSFGSQLEIVSIADFSVVIEDHDGNILSIEMFDDTIYVLIAGHGIYVIQRRTS